jgi:8-oxo-dGTP pyrophosphatase MutT (NUDIX family)
MENIKGVIIIIQNVKGQYFVHQRNSNKKTSPNLFGLGAGGHIEENETKEEAAKRELFEETRLKTELKYLFHKNYLGKYFTNDIDVFETIIGNENLKTNNGEWQWCGWVDKNKVDKLLKENKLCPDTAEIYKIYLDSVASWPQAAE